MIAGVDHVQIAAPPGAEPAARAFYGDVLGLRELPKPERLRPRGGAWFAVGDEQLHVGIEEPFFPARKAHPALAVPRATDLRALAERLDAAGHEVAWDGSRFYVADPFGNRLELIAPHADLRVRDLRDDERAWATRALREAWGSEVIVYGSGRERRPAELPALVADADGERAGLATYAVEGEEAELVTLNAFTVGAGAGGALVEAVADAARAAGCARLRVTTTNDNLPALRLYQRHAFALAALRTGAVEAARRIKPDIGTVGYAGIPIRDEIELERAL
jgi:catechol 2,3-dioxygenase-like lactoylglutathione lyase family enzyme